MFYAVYKLIILILIYLVNFWNLFIKNLFTKRTYLDIHRLHPTPSRERRDSLDIVRLFDDGFPLKINLEPINPPIPNQINVVQCWLAY